jgi:Protein of unknown function (DUF1254)
MTRTSAADHLTRRAIERRAIEAVIWGMPAVNFDLMLQAFVGTKGAPNQVVYWSRLIVLEEPTLTPNPDTIYVMPFYDTKDGPVVLEISPAGDGSITGSIDAERRAPTARPPCSSADVTGRSRTASRSWRARTTRCGCIARVPRFSAASGSFPRRGP